MILKRTFLVTAALIVIFGLSSCGESTETDTTETAITEDHIDALLSKPSAPKSIKLYNPTTSPSSDNTPTLKISGVKRGQNVYVYKSSSCKTSIKKAKAKSTSIKITLSALPNGNYKFYTRTSNSAGKSKCKGYVAYTVDQIAPASPAVVSPINASLVGSSPTLSGTCEIGTIVSISGDITPSPVTTSCAAGTFSKGITLTAGDGTKNLSLGAMDNAGNQSALIAHSLVLDTTAPTISLDPISNINGSNENSISISGSCTDDGDSVSITAPVGASGSTTCSGGAFTISNIDTSAVPDGTVNFTLAIEDEAGNSSSDTASVNKDTVTTVSIDPLSAINSSNAANYSFSGVCSNGDTIIITSPGSLSGTTTCALGVFDFTGLDISGLLDGSISFAVQATDAAGNTATDSDSVSKDTVPPTVSIGSPSVSSINTGNVDYVVTYTGASSINLLAANVTVTKTGTVAYTKSVSGGTTSTPTVRVVITGGDGKIDSIAIAAATSHDAAGNNDIGDSNGTDVTVDNTAPVVSIGAPNTSSLTSGNVDYEVTYTGASSINLLAANVTVTKTGTVAYTKSVSGGTTSTPTIRIAVSGGDGKIDSVAIAAGTSSDDVGNLDSGDSQGADVTVDNTAPTVSLSSPDYINNSNQNAYSLSGTCDEEGVTITLTAPAAVSGSTTTCSSSAFTFINLDVHTIPDGTINFTVSIVDALGNSSTDTESATKDITAPTISALALSSPATSPANDPTPAIEISGTFPIGDTFRLYSDMTCTTPISSSVAASSENSVTITSDALVDDTYTFFARGSDPAGNTTCEGLQSVSYTLDTEVPTIVITTPMTVINNVNKASYDFGGTCNDDTATVTITAPSGVTDSTLCSAGAFSFTGKDVSGEMDGLVNFTVRIEDPVGNFLTNSASATKDTVDPAITISALITITVSNQTNYSIVGTCTADGDTVTITTPAIAGSATCTGGAYSFTGKDVSGMSDSIAASFTLRNTDAAGNYATATRTVLKDTTRPTIPSCNSFTGNATPSKSDTLDWSGSIDVTSGINHYEMSIGYISAGDSVGWTDIGSTVTPYRFTGILPRLRFDIEYSTYIRAVDNVGLRSAEVTCSSWHVKPGYGNFRGTQSTDLLTPTVLNQATLYNLAFSDHHFNSEYMEHLVNSDKILIQEPGNYLLSLNVPLVRQNGNATGRVASAVNTVLVNDVAVPYAYAANSFTRGKDAFLDPVNGSNHMTIFLKHLKIGDSVKVTTKNNADSTEPMTVPAGAYFSNYLEYLPEDQLIFAATSNRTENGSDLNSATEKKFLWTQSSISAIYSHIDGSADIAIAQGGNFLISTNLPFNASAPNQKVEAHIYVDGSDQNYNSYTIATNGYVSGLHGHRNASTNYSNVLVSVPDGAVLHVTSQQLGDAGPVTVPVGTFASLYIQRIRSPDIKYFVSTGESVADWNTSDIVAWTVDHNIDTDYFTHVPGASAIEIEQDGDYVASVSAYITTNTDYVKPTLKIKVNGIAYEDAICSSSNTRQAPVTLNKANCDMTLLLQNLLVGDLVTFTTETDVISGAATGFPPRITLRKVSE